MPDDTEDLAGKLSGIISQRQQALGMVIEQSSMMEWNLRSVFCALVGSKYAAVVAGGQGAEWLIGRCEALTEINREMHERPRQALLEALRVCRTANQGRNEVVHGAKTASGEDGRLIIIRERTLSHPLDVKPWTSAEMSEVAAALGDAGQQLVGALLEAVPPHLAAMDQALASEIQQSASDGQRG